MWWIFSNIFIQISALGRKQSLKNTPNLDLIKIGIVSLLKSLFAFIRHDNTARGFAFEETIREELIRLGFNVKYGRKNSIDGKEREFDALVQIKNKLYMLECFSSERSLDFEIGNPDTINRRKKLFIDKVD